MKNIWRLFELVPGYKVRLMKVVVVNSILGLVGLASPYLFKNILDFIVEAVKSGGYEGLATKLLLALTILLAVHILGAIFDYIAERLSDLLFIDVMWEIRKKIFQHLSRLSIDYYERTRAGEIMERVSTGTMDFSRWGFSISDGLLGSVISIILILTFLWIKLPLVGLIMSISLPLNFYWATVKVIKTKPLRREWHRHAEKGMGEMTETMNQISTVRSFAQEKYKFNRYIAQVDGYRHLRVEQSKIEWATNFYRHLLNAVTLVLAIGVVAYGVINGHNTTGDVLLVALYLQQLRGSINPLARLIVSTGDIETSSERLTEILDVQPTVVDSKGAKKLTAIKTIEFKDVSFSYPGKSIEILKNISFRIAEGQTLALVGPSGVGKTTITKLLIRFYAPTSGEILINGRPIEEFTQDSLRSLIGTVMQDVTLFNETIEENLRFARPGATQAELEKAAAISHADIFITKLPDGYKSLVGERGIKLSGGEKQRVAIARAILRNPQLVILDEATSALDSESEAYVQDGLRKLLENKTAVIIAHRLSTVMRADKILVLKDGKVVEEGNHAELIKKTGLYHKLFTMQSAHAKSQIL